jgi:hypothetical protein
VGVEPSPESVGDLHGFLPMMMTSGCDKEEEDVGAIHIWNLCDSCGVWWWYFADIGIDTHSL